MSWSSRLNPRALARVWPVGLVWLASPLACSIDRPSFESSEPFLTGKDAENRPDATTQEKGERGWCEPCSQSSQCGPGSCVAHGKPPGAAGFFCQQACDPTKATETCPTGTHCGETSTLEGAGGFWCLPDAQACGCTAATVTHNWTTTCMNVAHDSAGGLIGACEGTWACGTDGQAKCSAKVPKAEVCNGQDDDCDGATDEVPECTPVKPTCTSAKDCPAPADACTQEAVCDSTAGCKFVPRTVTCQDDGNPCTTAACDPATGLCAQTLVADKTACDDGNSCTQSSGCIGGVCKGAGPVPCDDGNACTSDGCDSKGGCTHKPSDQACDDGNLCTHGDQCQAGACKGQASGCDDGNACTADGCSPKSGCTHQNLTAACNDGDACTTGDACQGGACKGKGVGCDDGNVCTLDVCQGAGCQHLPNAGGACSDGNACTSGDVCQGGACVGVVASCDDGNPCTQDACDPKAGCGHGSLAGKACDDGNPCTGGETCSQAGTCQGGANVCACLTDADCTGGQGGNLCLGKMKCDKSGPKPACVVIPGTQVQCPAAPGPCAAYACQPATGTCAIQPAGQGLACDDGNACTQGDVCQAGQCKPGGAVACSDGKACTLDSCDKAKGCVFSPASGPCDDGDACTTGDSCSGGACLAGKPLICNDANPCTADTCSKASGCGHAPVDGACDDGNACTKNDVCTAGKCQAGAPISCDDANGCTLDSCSPKAGCVHSAASGPCGAKDACTSQGACQAGACVAGKPISCDDGHACTQDACDPKLGCTHVPNSVACNDNSVCTKDSCSLTSGCVHAPVAGACDDGDLCTTGDSCSQGKCQPGTSKDCPSDGKSCTHATCVAGVCGQKVDPDGTPCTSAGCKGEAACQAGKCEPVGECVPGVPSTWPIPIPSSFEPAKTFYDPTGYHVISLSLPSSSWNEYLDAVKTASTSKKWYKADVTIDGVKYEDVGIRKFGYGSMLSNPEKPNIRVKFDAFVPDQVGPAGLRNVRLKAAGQDATFIREPLTYAMIRALGGIAPRSSFGRVTINGESYGLYQVLEQVDERMFHDNFDNKKGQNYEVDDGCMGLNCPPSGCSDIKAYYDSDNDEPDYTVLINLAKAIDAGPSSSLMSNVAKYANVDALLAFYVTDAALSNVDGMNAAGRNYEVYQDYDTKKLYFILTGADLTWGNWGAKYPMDEPWGPPCSWCTDREDHLWEGAWYSSGFKDELFDKMEYARCHVLKPTKVNPMVDGFKDLLKNDLYYDPKGDASKSQIDSEFSQIKSYAYWRYKSLEALVGECD